MTTPKPTQEEVDCVASYVEATAELKAEPFYASDEPRTISSHGEKHTYRIGDRFHFRSALITFRRIWMKGDAENFEHVCNILIKHGTPVERLNVQFARGLVRGETNRTVGFPRPLGIKSSKLVDLWLNSVFAHSGLRGQDKSRHEFDEMVEKHGQGAMEFAFRHSVWIIGLQYAGLGEIASSMLARWRKEHNLVPSFTVGSAFGTKLKERTKNGDLIIRQSSSQFFSEETYEQQFERVLGRSKFGNLKSALGALGFTTRELLKLVLKYDDYAKIVGQSIYEFRLVEAMPVEAVYHSGLRFQAGLYDHTSKTVSRLEASDDEIVTDAAGLALINNLLQTFKTELTRE